MNDDTFNAYIILADKFYAGKNPNADEWNESFIVTGFVHLQGALDWVNEVAKEHQLEAADDDWSVSILASQKERREYGLLETTYSIEQVEIVK